ncbi:MAG: putative lipid II flippase FtsW [Clostridiales bacterium]|nr:putative lipid II flippase FtsW [Candidatus Equinaster intestinalis]
MEKSENKAPKKLTRSKKKFDITFFSLVSILLVIGLIMLFSASYVYSLNKFGTNYKFILNQSIYAVIGLAGMVIASLIDYHFYRKFAWIIYLASLAMLAFVAIVPPMIPDSGVKRWIAIGGFSFQPSEIAKFAVILILSHLISKNYHLMGKFKFVALLVVILGAVCVLVVVEPHLSATVLILAIGAVLMIIGGIKMIYVIIGAAVGIGGAFLAIISGIVSYGGDRIKYWLDPWADASGKGYQTIQSLLAIGSGGLLGRGIGKSHQKYLYIPEPQNDFIFAVVCEELGVIGAMIIILLFCALVWRGFTIAMKAPDKFGCLLAVGLTFQVGLQALLNILVVTNTVPNTGISLPFFSYGGTSLVILLTEMGIVLNISRQASLKKL